MSHIEAIVIGGSAGALDALLAILPGLPEQLSCPIVIVLHLPPAQPSLVPEILSRACARTVHEAVDKAPLRDLLTADVFRRDLTVESGPR